MSKMNGLDGTTDWQINGMTMREYYKAHVHVDWDVARTIVRNSGADVTVANLVGVLAELKGEIADALLAEDEEHRVAQFKAQQALEG